MADGTSVKLRMREPIDERPWPHDCAAYRV